MKTHPLNVSYLVIGLAFLGISGSWALHQAGVIDAADVEWLLPLTLVIAGAIGLVAFFVRGLDGRRTGETRYRDDNGMDNTYDDQNKGGIR
jgi:hypothetical protein